MERLRRLVSVGAIAGLMAFAPALAWAGSTPPGGTPPGQPIPQTPYSIAPSLHITTPQQGQFFSKPKNGPSFGAISVAGSVMYTGATPVVTVDGVAAPVGFDGTFATLTFVDHSKTFNTIAIEMLDPTNGAITRRYVTVVTEDSLPITDRAPQAAMMFLRESTISSLMQTLAPEILDGVPKEYLQPGFLLTQPTDSGDVHVSLLAPVTIQNFTADVAPKSGSSANEGHLELKVGFQGLTVELEVEASYQFGMTQVPKCQMTISSNGTITSPFHLAGDPSQPGSVTSDFHGASVTLNDYWPGVHDCSGSFNEKLATALLSSENADLIREIVRQKIHDVVESEVDFESIVDVAFAGIDLATPLSAPLGVSLDTDFTAILPEDGGVRSELACAMTNALSQSPSVDLKFSDQYVRHSRIPDLGRCAYGPYQGNACRADSQCVFGPCTFETPNTQEKYDIALGVSPTLFSQRLRTMTEQGAFHGLVATVDLGDGDLNDDGQPDLDFDMDGKSDYVGVNTLSLGILRFLVFPLLFPPYQLPLDAPLALRVTPTIAPILTGAPGPHGSDFELLIAGIRIALFSPSCGVEEVRTMSGQSDDGSRIETGDGLLALTGSVLGESSEPRESSTGISSDASGLPFSAPADGGSRSPSIPSDPGSFGFPWIPIDLTADSDVLLPGCSEPETTWLEIELDARLGLDFVADAETSTIIPKLAPVGLDDLAWRIIENRLDDQNPFYGVWLDQTGLPAWLPSVAPSLAGSLESITLPAELQGMKLSLSDVAPVGSPADGRHLVIFTRTTPVGGIYSQDIDLGF